MSSTLGKSKSPEQKIHHTFWYYRVGKRGNLLDHIYCDECNTSYPSSVSMRNDHPSDEFMINKTIKHVVLRRK